MHQRPKQSSNVSRVSRREVLKVASAGGAASATAKAARADAADNIDSLIAKPPAGFRPLNVPGKIVKVSAKGEFASYMQPNQLWPKPEVARRLRENALTEEPGTSSLSDALAKFIHKDDVVAVKVNGIAGQKGYTMATNFELILPV